MLLVIAHALREGRRATIPTCLGVVAGDALAVTVSLAGMGALIAASATLFTLLKWLGAAYLIWLGVRTLMERRSEPASDRPAGAVSSRKMAARAFIVTALNPKSIAFFVAFLPQFVDPGAAVAPQFIPLGATFVALAGITNLGYAMAGAHTSGLMSQPLAQRIIQWTSGSVAGVMTAAIRRA